MAVVDKFYVVLPTGGEFVTAASSHAEAVAVFCIAEVIDKTEQHASGPPADLWSAYWVHRGRAAKAEPVRLASAMQWLSRSDWQLLNSGLELNVPPHTYRDHCDELIRITEKHEAKK
ncbi:hypothetical protein V7x_24610 [Crateriforma conspicua]|uniref:Uncharacterized protein n=1 Tax=Crateriforma conspicua TaxID=2527996 RepID=A0A5C6G013_9PLAN|nr:hypothetical protein [Crateriforma conspicua]TWU66890.1 hypothetical protein V7x_24610 [Crateriforma conspicua]